MPRFQPPGQCPVCGEWVPRKAVACNCCGACALSGWKADAGHYDGLDLPDEDDSFDYDKFVAEEFGAPHRPHGISPLWWWVAVLLLAAFAYSFLKPLWG